MSTHSTDGKLHGMDTTKGYIALTDPDWYRYLSTRPHLDEVNFWQPHGDHAFRALKPGETFFFKLRAPARDIAGFGFFQRFESMPARYAWDRFDEAKGVPDFESMLDRIARLRREPSPLSGEFKIGCIMIAAPVFFVPDEWVRPPADWAKSGLPGRRRPARRLQERTRYYGLDGSKIALPDQQLWRPKGEFLEWHQQHVFRGRTNALRR